MNELIHEADPTLRRRRLAQISGHAMVQLSNWSIGDIFPSLDPELNLLDLQLPVRATNALVRQNCLRAAELNALTLESIIEWRNVGTGTVESILQVLADASATSLSTEGSAADRSNDQLVARDALSAVVADIETIANWHESVGLHDTPLLSGPCATGTPDDVAAARQRMQDLCARHLIESTKPSKSFAELLSDALRSLDDREILILRRRSLSEDPSTLEEVGQALDITRERVRQIEARSRERIVKMITEDDAMSTVAETVRKLVTSVRPLDDLLRLVPALGELVTPLYRPAWWVLDRFEDEYEILDGWCAAPTLTLAQATTQEKLQDQADTHGVVDLADSDLVETAQPDSRHRTLTAWLTRCGFVVLENLVLTRTQSVGDYGAAILSLAKSPLTTQEMASRFRVERSPQSIRNAISTDPRFARVDRDKWSLREWGLETYEGIRPAIHEQVTQNGGRISLDSLVEAITGKFTVTEKSVASYASQQPFSMKNGVVSLATSDRQIRKTPEQTRRLFRRNNAWSYRLKVTADHLRGSGSIAPLAIASVVHIQHGQTRQLDSPLGPMSVHWSGGSPSFGTIRRFLADQNIDQDREVFLIFHDDSTFGLEPARQLTGNPVADALTLTGSPETDDPCAARIALTAAVGLSETSPVASVIGTYHERGDDDIADLMTIASEQLGSSHKPSQAKHNADIGDILDLL